MKHSIALLFFFYLFSCNSPIDETKDRAAIQAVLMDQQKAWSENDIEKFMEGYWKSDSLKFYSGAKLNKGWQNTLENYKTRYPSKAYSGTLNFKIADITKINDDAYWVMGEYHLTREVGDVKGTFIIIFKRIDGKWKIVADSSC